MKFRFSYPISGLLLLVTGMVGCAGGDPSTAGIIAPKATPTPHASGLAGGVSGTSATPTPNPNATPTPTPSPSPTPINWARSVTISPNSPRLSLPATNASGAPALYPTTAQLTALVVFQDQSTASAVTWGSLDAAIATVSVGGLVTILGPGIGAGPWTVGIKATSVDGSASSVINVGVDSAGGVALTVE